MNYIDNDYINGAHTKILQRMLETNDEQTPGYGFDCFSDHAKDLMKKACGTDDIDIHFLTGGTQANIVAIANSLRVYHGVISADTGHINNFEAGAIEAIGHQLLTVPGNEGKLSAKDVRALATDTGIHYVQPGMVYISNPTEMGTIYSKAELTALREVCNEFDLLLFMDGARLGYGLVAEDNDLSLKDITELCDIFYFGGTKIGALFGEALVIRNKELRKGIQTTVKQKGALLAKGRALGIQFEVLFEDDFYLELSKHAVSQARKLKEAFDKKGIPFKYKVQTNQLFPILTNNQYEKLSEKYVMLHEGVEANNNILVRICTSWSSSDEMIEELVADIEALT